MPAIKSFIDKYIYHKQENVPPPITTNTATALLIVYTLIYVVPFYLSPRTRPSPDLSRDAPSVIRARIASVTLTCVVCSAATFYVLTNQGRAPALDAAHLMGYLPVGLVEAGKTTLLTAILFAGPLFEHLVVEGAWRDWLRLAPLRELFNEWTVWRNIGPVTEEVLFRSAAVPLMLLARTSIPKTIFLSPVIFGLAHVHHFYEFRITHRQVPLAAALARSAFQLAYTTLFGAYATFLFLRTGSLLAICLAHAFCNCMGLPRVWGRVQPPGGEGGDDDVAVAVAVAPREGGERGGSATTAKRPTLLWTVAYYCLLVGGALTWYRNLWRLTTSPQALVPMDGW